MINGMTKIESRQWIKIILLMGATIIITSVKIFAQTPAQIFNPAVPATNKMDPDGDGWISASGVAFVSEDGISESEMGMIPIPQYAIEPDADLQTGSNCGKTDIVDLPAGKEASYILYNDVDGIADNGNDLLFMRIRLAQPATSGSFGYSVLLDTDEKFGFSGPNADPNAVSGNPGFEIEVRVKTGGGPGIYVENVNGTTSGSAIVSYSIDSNYQQSYALINDANCSGAPVFHDFFVKTSQIGINSNTKLRPLSATSSSGNSVLGGSASDIGGINDNGENQDSLMIDVITFIPSTSGSNLMESGTFPVELAEFTGEYSNGTTQLTWVTLSESNNMKFEVQSSIDNGEYSTFSEVKGSGSSTSKKFYRATDANPYPGSTYYRLKQSDLDGSFRYSNAIEVVTGAFEQEFLTVYPNPSAGPIFLQLSLSSTEPALVEIFDFQNRLVMQFLCGDSPGNIITTADLSDMPKGIYLVRATQNSRRRVRKIMLE